LSNEHRYEGTRSIEDGADDRGCRLGGGLTPPKENPTAEAAGELKGPERCRLVRGMCTERRRPIWPNPYYLSVKRFTPRVFNEKSS
jgi:hypothetical protein